MTVEFREMFPDGVGKLAEKAFDGLRVGARFASMGLMTAQDERVCILDGSAYSPSWRALPEGQRVWVAAQACMDPEEGAALMEEFDETLEECIREWSGRHEETMGWEEGCLFVFGPEFDFEQL